MSKGVEKRNGQIGNKRAKEQRSKMHRNSSMNKVSVKKQRRKIAKEKRFLRLKEQLISRAKEIKRKNAWKTVKDEENR